MVKKQRKVTGIHMKCEEELRKMFPAFGTIVKFKEKYTHNDNSYTIDTGTKAVIVDALIKKYKSNDYSIVLKFMDEDGFTAEMSEDTGISDINKMYDAISGTEEIQNSIENHVNTLVEKLEILEDASEKTIKYMDEHYVRSTRLTNTRFEIAFQAIVLIIVALLLGEKAIPSDTSAILSILKVIMNVTHWVLIANVPLLLAYYINNNTIESNLTQALEQIN